MKPTGGSIFNTLVLLALSIFAGSSSIAAVLDWNAVDWTARFGSGTTASQTFNNVDGSGVNVTITVTAGPNTGNGELNDPTNLPEDTNTPISHNYETAQQALMIDANFTNRTNDFITVTISFSQTVYGVSYELWDIDLGNSGVSTYQDRITLDRSNQTITILGSNNADGSTAVDAAVQAGTNNTVIRGIATSGSTSNLGNENDALNSGDVRVDYGGGGLTSLSFTYTSGDGSPVAGPFGNNTTLQRIALGDITFSPVPEVFSGGGALAACVIAICSTRLGRRRPRPPVAG